MKRNVIELPCSITYGNDIYMIEDESRTGLEPDVYKNRVLGFTHTEVIHRYTMSHPVYRTPLSEYKKTWFLDEFSAKEKLKELTAANASFSEE